MSYCKVQMIGNLTRDPEVKQVGSGTSVANVGLATNKRIKSGDNYTEKVSFHDLVLWGKQAEIFCKYLSKGSQVFIDGELEYDEWEDKESGKNRRKAVIRVNEFKMLGGKNSSSDNSQPSAPANTDIPDDDVPF